MLVIADNDDLELGASRYVGLKHNCDFSIIAVYYIQNFHHNSTFSLCFVTVQYNY